MLTNPRYFAQTRRTWWKGKVLPKLLTLLVLLHQFPIVRFFDFENLHVRQEGLSSLVVNLIEGYGFGATRPFIFDLVDFLGFVLATAEQKHI